MAEVFKASHRYLGCIRAVKVLHPEVSAEADTIGRLLTEARALARLRHPAIVEVHECDVLGDTAFIAMEYLAGESLRVWLDRIGPLSQHPRLAAAVVAAIGEGLAFAHGRGVVHRDLKPENILVLPDPADRQKFSLKILDFGLARVHGEEPLTSPRTGCVVGTALYMAPERWHASQPVDHRSDIYALGCLLFELLHGQPPFCENTDAAIMRAHLVDAPPELTALVPELPAAFQPLVSRMLAKSPADRHDSVEQVLAELEPILGRDRSSWSEQLRMPSSAAVSMEVLDDDTKVDALVIPGRRVPLPSWLHNSPVGQRWLRLLLRLTAILRKRAGHWFTRRRLAWALAGSVLGSLLILGTALLLAARPPASDRRDSASGSSVVTPRPAGRASPAAAAPARPQPPTAVTSSAGVTASKPAPAAPRPRRAPSAGRDSYSVRVTSDPPGAEAWLPGEKTARGRTPLDIQLKSAKPGRVFLVAPGFKTAKLTISRTRAGAPVHARLVPADRARRPSTGRRQTRSARDPSFVLHPISY
jgi:serine/threonine protein kinase